MPTPRKTKVAAELAVVDARTPAAWERWLERNHDKTPEGVWLRMYKKGEFDGALTWNDAVDVALCYGWIDGQSRKHDDVSRVQRFTPRRKNGSWSKINVERTER